MPANAPSVKCPRCKGEGTVTLSMPVEDGWAPYSVENCPRCKGSGESVGQKSQDRGREPRAARTSAPPVASAERFTVDPRDFCSEPVLTDPDDFWPPMKQRESLVTSEWLELARRKGWIR